MRIDKPGLRAAPPPLDRVPAAAGLIELIGKRLTASRLPPGQRPILSPHGNLSRLAGIEAIAARMLAYKPPAAGPTYISIFGSAGVGKSTTVAALTERDPSLVVIGFGNEMMKTLAVLGPEAIAQGFATADRDGLRTAPTAAHDWLIDRTLERVAAQYNDPSHIYLIDGHNTVTTADGPTLGLSPFRAAAPPLDLSRAIVLTDTPDNIARHMRADPRRKRDPDTVKIDAQQELIRSLALANQHFAGAPYTELTAPPLGTVAYEEFVEALQINVYRLAIRSHSPGDLKTYRDTVTPASAPALFASGEIFKYIPEFRALGQRAAGHKALVIDAFHHFIEGDFRTLYDRLRNKDTDFETYAANFGRLKERYDALPPELKELAWLLILFHDDGKMITTLWHHVEIGEAMAFDYAAALGLDDRAARLWSAAEGKHGHMGEVILAERLPGLFLDKAAEVEAAGLPHQLFIDLTIIANVMDLAGFGGGRIIRNEYLLEFLSFLDRDNIKQLCDNWDEERLKRLSKDPDADFYGPFSEANYRQMLRLFDLVIPAGERTAFRDFLKNKLTFALSIEMLSSSKKNRLKLLRLLMHLSDRLAIKGASVLTSFPPNWKELYPVRLDRLLDGVPDDYDGAAFDRNFGPSAAYGIRYCVQGKKIILDFAASLK